MYFRDIWKFYRLLRYYQISSLIHIILYFYVLYNKINYYYLFFTPIHNSHTSFHILILSSITSSYNIYSDTLLLIYNISISFTQISPQNHPSNTLYLLITHILIPLILFEIIHIADNIQSMIFNLDLFYPQKLNFNNFLNVFLLLYKIIKKMTEMYNFIFNIYPIW